VHKIDPAVGPVCRSALSALARRGGFQLAVLFAALVGTALPGLAQEGTVKAQHGDWQIVCKDPPPGAKNEVCALVQSVTAEDKDNIGLTVYFQKFSNGTRVLRVFAPLGILLPPGLGLKIDDKDVGHAPFLRCHTFACYAQVVVEDPLIEQLKNGKTAIFIIFQAEEKDTGNPFYQMFVMDLKTGKSVRVSPGVGRTTCGYFHPDGKKIIFASSHGDPDAKKVQESVKNPTGGWKVGASTLAPAKSSPTDSHAP